MKLIKVLYLTNNIILISQLEEVTSEIGEPDCKMTNPFLIKLHSVLSDQVVLEPFMMDCTHDKSFMISSDKILTIADPTMTLLKKYEDLTKE